MVKEMKSKSFAKRIALSAASLLLAAILCFSSMVCAFADNQSDLEEKIAAAQKKADELSGEKADANAEYQAKLDLYNVAADAVVEINEEITALEAKIERTQKEIKELDVKIAKQEKLIDQEYEAFTERLKALYISGSFTAVQMLLSAGDFSEYLTRLEMVRKVSQQDNAAIDEMTKLAEEMEADQKVLDENKVKLESEKETLEKDKISLDEKKELAEKAKNESLEVLQKIKAQENQNNAELAEYKEELNDILAEIARQEAARKAAEEAARKAGTEVDPNTTIVTGSGQFCNPVPGHARVSCGFYGYYNHNGIDISDGSIYGATVVAADAGTVVRVKYLTYSYGYHIYVYHGNGLTTQYCHLSAIYVSEGQTVSKGQSIGAVGSTGNSTGPHLHFGIFNSGGTFLDPANYL